MITGPILVKEVQYIGISETSILAHTPPYAMVQKEIVIIAPLGPQKRNPNTHKHPQVHEKICWIGRGSNPGPKILAKSFIFRMWCPRPLGYRNSVRRETTFDINKLLEVE